MRALTTFGLRETNSLMPNPETTMATTNHKTYSVQSNTMHFPSSNEHWTRSDKQLFLIFMRILLKYLELTHLEETRREVMEAIAQCRSSYLRRRANHQICLTSMLYDHLSEVVPDPVWHQTETYMEQYLLSRRSSRSGSNRQGTRTQAALADE